MKIAPLPGSFMLASLLGIFVSILLVMPMSLPWGFAFLLVFVCMLIASFVSLAKADADAQLELDAMEKR